MTKPELKVIYSETISLTKKGSGPVKWEATRNGERVGKGTTATFKGAWRRSRKAIDGKQKKSIGR